MSLCQSTSLPSLAHYSCAQILATFSGMGFCGLRTTSTLRPITCSAHRVYLGPRIPHRATGASDAKVRSALTEVGASVHPALGLWRCVPWLSGPNLQYLLADGAFCCGPSCCR